MSKRARKREMGYELATPVCVSCANYQPPRLALRNSLPGMQSAALCRLGQFAVHPFACCDKWAGRRGETLDGAASKPTPIAPPPAPKPQPAA